MSGSKIAYRYAKSLLEVAQEKGVLEVVYNDMMMVRDTLLQNEEFLEYINSPIVKMSDKMEVGRKLFLGKIDSLSMRFLSLLGENGREDYFLAVVSRFITLYDELKEVEVANVISAVALDKKIITRMQNHVAKLTGKEIDIVEEIDKDLIGGYILKIGDYQYDASVKNNVQKLHREFKENLYIPKL